MTRRVLGALIFLNLLLLICIVSPTERAAASVSKVHSATVSRCFTSQLAIRPDSSNSGLGHVGLYFRLQNVSNRTCELFGYPGVQLLDARGRPMHTVLHWGVGYLSGNQARRAVYLHPRGDAFFLLEWVHFPYPGQTCPPAPAVFITPPNTYRPIWVRIPRAIDACGGIINAAPVEPVRLP